VSRFDGGPFQSRDDNLVATNGLLHEDLLAVIQGYRQRRS
jgi:hypothetical protein